MQVKRGDYPKRVDNKSEYEKIFMDKILPSSLQTVARYDVPLSEITGEKVKLRLDFYIEHHGRRIAFELDGHRSHYTDPVQIERDDRKNALCRKHDILIYRFTGRLVEHTSACKRLVKKLVFTKPYPDQLDSGKY